MRTPKLRGLLLFLYIIFALYFINYPFGIIKIPENFSSIEPWIIFVGGVLLIIGGFNYFRRRKMYY
jgi:predicted membrane channel-forming protein YqfA (hemolysin III family)